MKTQRVCVCVRPSVNYSNIPFKSQSSQELQVNILFFSSAEINEKMFGNPCFRASACTISRPNTQLCKNHTAAIFVIKHKR